MTVATQLRITRVQAHRYRMPLRRPYGTARGVTKAATNFVVTVTARSGESNVEGIGECQPRHTLTGDGDRRGDDAWEFLGAACDRLHDRNIEVGGREEAVAAIRTLMAELDDVAHEHADDGNRDRPFRGTLLGIEVALLDIASRALGLQVCELLGKRRDEIGISISTISSNVQIDEVAGRVVKQRRFPMTRVKGIGDIAYNWQLLETVANANRSMERAKPIWIDINEAFDVEAATTFIDGVVDRMAAGQLPASVVIEGVLPKAQVTELPRLQHHADDACELAASSGKLDLRIMPDEGMWDVTDLERVNAAGGCRALNIKAPKAGGLIASLDLAEAAVAANPDVHISVGGMLGTSDITAWTLHNLARTLPRIDYLTTVPPTNVEERIAEPRARYREQGSNIIAAQTSPGLGTSLVQDKLLPYISATLDTSPTDSAHHGSSAAVVQESSVSSTEKRRAETRERPHGPGSVTLVFGGDTSLGDVHLRTKGGELLERLENEPLSFFAGIRNVIQDNDALILNFETVLADSPTSPFEGRKAYLGWDSPDRTVSCLKELGVSALSMANNHTMDFGAKHMLATKELLERSGIEVFGAGASTLDAKAPLTMRFTLDGEERRVYVIGAMEIQTKLRDEYHFYASERSPGVNPMATPEVVEMIKDLRATDPSALIILVPHWGRNYKWAAKSAQTASTELYRAGADLVIGHGAHMLQQCTANDTNATVYSLGNFVFNWSGRFNKYDVPPFGLVARLDAGFEHTHWNLHLRLYPIMSDNRSTGFRPRLASEQEFISIVAQLNEHDIDGSFKERADTGADQYGRHISFSLKTTERLPRGRHIDGLRSTTPAAQMRTADPRDSVSAEETATPQRVSRSRLSDRLNSRAMDSHLLEREALALGLCTLRLAPVTFMAGPTTDRIGEIGFHRTASMTTSRVARDILADRRHLEAVLRDAGLPYEDDTQPCYRALVVDGRTVSVVHRDDNGTRVVTDETHPEILGFAVRALSAVPGLGHAGVELAAEDHRKPPSDQHIAVVNMDSAPKLASYGAAAGSTSSDVARVLVGSCVDDAVDTTRRLHHTGARVSLIGISPTGTHQETFNQLSAELGLDVHDAESNDDRLSAMIAGDVDDVAALSALMMARSRPPEAVETIPATAGETRDPENEK